MPSTDIFDNSLTGFGSRGTLASDPGTSGTTFTLTTGHGARFPTVTSPTQKLRLNIQDEIVFCTAHAAAADTMTVLRAQEGTTGATHAVGTAVNAVITAGTMNDLVVYVDARSRRGLFDAGLIPASTRQSKSQSSAVPQSNGTDVYANTRIRHKALFNVTSFRLVYGNLLNIGTSPATSTITIKAAVEAPGGGMLPVRFGGIRAKTIEADALVLSDPLGLELLTGDWFFTRSFVEARDAAGALIAAGKWPHTHDTALNHLEGSENATPASTLSTATPSTSGGTLAANTYYYKVTVLKSGGESIASNELSAVTTGATSSVVLVWTAVTNATGYRIYRGTAAGVENVYYTVGAVTTYTDTNAGSTGGAPPLVPIDKTLSGTITALSGFAYGPVAIVAYGPSGQTTLVFAGDSITEAGGPAGYPELLAGDGPMYNIALYGERVASAVPNTAPNAGRAIMSGIGDYTGSLYGSNDLANPDSLATIQANLIAHWRQLVANGARVWQGTILPRTTSSDGFVTVANQTVPAWESVRVALNTWIRGGAPIDTAYRATTVGAGGSIVAGTGIHPLTRYFEFAYPLESANDSGKWAVPASPAPLYTTDGTHAVRPAQEIMAGVLRGNLGETLTLQATSAPTSGTSGTYRAAVLTDTPTVYLRLGEQIGQFAYDQQSAAGGTIIGGVTLAATGATTADTDTAMSFNGTTGNIEIPDLPAMRVMAGFTLEAFVKVSSLTTGMTFAYRYGTSGQGFTWGFLGPNGFQSLNVNGVVVYDNGGGGVMTVNVFNHIAVSYAANGDVRFYLNGAATSTVANQAIPTGRAASPGDPGINLGSANGATYFQGTMDEFAYYPTVLTPTRILAHYNAR